MGIDSEGGNTYDGDIPNHLAKGDRRIAGKGADLKSMQDQFSAIYAK